MLEAFEVPGRFRRGNLHGHSTGSDGALAPAEVCRRYREAGYDFVAISDHFLGRYGFPVTDTRGFREAGFTTLLAAELHAPATSRGDLWHIVAAGLPAGFAGPGEGETAAALARRAAEAGAFVALAHPHWSQLTPEDGLAIDAAHAVEVYNHKSAIEVDRGDGLVLFDALLHAGRRVLAIASDDSHWHGPDAFAGWVMVRTEANEPDALLEALKRGAFYASQGPEIHHVARDGGRAGGGLLAGELDHPGQAARLAAAGARRRSDPRPAADRAGPGRLAAADGARRLRPAGLEQPALAGELTANHRGWVASRAQAGKVIRVSYGFDLTKF